LCKMLKWRQSGVRMNSMKWIKTIHFVVKVQNLCLWCFFWFFIGFALTFIPICCIIIIYSLISGGVWFENILHSRYQKIRSYHTIGGKPI
jgi:hypothetical protein